MSPNRLVPFKELARDTGEPLVTLSHDDFLQVPGGAQPPLNPPKPRWQETYDFSLDGFSDLDIPKLNSSEQEDRLVRGFLSGLAKLFDPESNWPFVKMLRLSMDYCVRCQTCSEACHTYLASGRQNIYRPTYRSEVLRRLYQRYLTPGGRLLGPFVGADIEANYRTIWRLLELSYRCNICRRCAMVCPVGVDNALLAREVRKLFSQEMGIAPVELYKKGTRQHLKAGSTTGMTPAALRDTVEFAEEEIQERTGIKVKIPVDKKGADVLLIHNAGEFLAWPENPYAFAILFEAAGIDWTLSSDLMGYDAVNYGTWFDDVELGRVLLRHVKTAKDLGVKRMVVGECGHAHKALCVLADRILPGDMSLPDMPRESCLPLLWQIVQSGAVKLDPSRNNFPVTLHDPCNIVRLMGIVRPQRDVLKAACAQPLREMAANGPWNYCCGGGSGFAIMNSLNFADWRVNVSQRMKMAQIMEAFQGLPPDGHKYVCAPCSNCKGAIRDGLDGYKLGANYNIHYGGLAELIVNAMVDLPKPFFDWQSGE